MATGESLSSLGLEALSKLLYAHASKGGMQIHEGRLICEAKWGQRSSVSFDMSTGFASSASWLLTFSEVLEVVCHSSPDKVPLHVTL